MPYDKKQRLRIDELKSQLKLGVGEENKVKQEGSRNEKKN